MGKQWGLLSQLGHPISGKENYYFISNLSKNFFLTISVTTKYPTRSNIINAQMLNVRPVNVKYTLPNGRDVIRRTKTIEAKVERRSKFEGLLL